MVHALREAWRVLRSSGFLVDLRPRHSNQLIELIIDQQPEIVTCYTDDYRVERDVAADKAVAVAVDSRLFCLEDSASFRYVKHYDTGTELMDYFETRNPPVHHPEEIVERIYRAGIGTNTTIRFTNDMQLLCYSKLDG